MSMDKRLEERFKLKEAQLDFQTKQYQPLNKREDDIMRSGWAACETVIGIERLKESQDKSLMGWQQQRQKEAIGMLRGILTSCAQNAGNRGAQRFIVGELNRVSEFLSKPEPSTEGEIS